MKNILLALAAILCVTAVCCLSASAATWPWTPPPAPAPTPHVPDACTPNACTPIPAIPPVPSACQPAGGCNCGQQEGTSEKKHGPVRRILRGVWNHRPGIVFRRR